ncbi:MAG: hypothetical protein AB1571_04405, partial [Nanoarchaeota archaeon]
MKNKINLLFFGLILLLSVSIVSSAWVETNYGWKWVSGSAIYDPIYTFYQPDLSPKPFSTALLGMDVWTNKPPESYNVGDSGMLWAKIDMVVPKDNKIYGKMTYSLVSDGITEPGGGWKLLIPYQDMRFDPDVSLYTSKFVVPSNLNKEELSGLRILVDFDARYLNNMSPYFFVGYVGAFNAGTQITYNASTQITYKFYNPNLSPQPLPTDVHNIADVRTNNAPEKYVPGQEVTILAKILDKDGNPYQPGIGTRTVSYMLVSDAIQSKDGGWKPLIYNNMAYDYATNYYMAFFTIPSDLSKEAMSGLRILVDAYETYPGNVSSTQVVRYVGAFNSGPLPKYITSETNQTGELETNQTGENITRNISSYIELPVPVKECNGCLIDTTCLPFGMRV